MKGNKPGDWRLPPDLVVPERQLGESDGRQQSGAAAFPRNERHAVLPTTELVLRQIRPADVAQAFNGLETVVRDGKPYSCYDRIIDTDNQVRFVLSVGAARCDRQGGEGDWFPG